METQIIHETAVIGEGFQCGYFVVIEENAVIGRNVTIGNHVTIYAGTVIGDGCTLHDGCVLGKQPKPAKTSTVKYDQALPPLSIGQEVTVGTNAVIYAGSTLGKQTVVADLASVREKCILGRNVVIGRGVTVENTVQIGDYTKVQSNAYITAYMTLEDHVFIAPCVTFTNDNFMGRTKERFKYIKGATVKRGARVGGGSIVLPGIEIAQETFVAAGALVTKNTDKETLVKGVPAAFSRKVPEQELLINQE